MTKLIVNRVFPTQVGTNRIVAGTEHGARTKQAPQDHDDSIIQVKGERPMAHTCWI